jgi:hypothetical protein
MSDLTELQELIGQFILDYAMETAEQFEEHTSDSLDEYDPIHTATLDDVEVLSNGLDAKHSHLDVDEDQPAILVIGYLDGSCVRQTRRARHNPPGKAHPAEYERTDVTLGVEVIFYPEGLGRSQVTVRQMEDPYAPPTHPDI